jgi:hypothetical protein
LGYISESIWNFCRYSGLATVFRGSNVWKLNLPNKECDKLIRKLCGHYHKFFKLEILSRCSCNTNLSFVHPFPKLLKKIATTPEACQTMTSRSININIVCALNLPRLIRSSLCWYSKMTCGLSIATDSEEVCQFSAFFYESNLVLYIWANFDYLV